MAYVTVKTLDCVMMIKR